jgi:uncharacterized RDD family membrane protein YckC
MPTETEFWEAASQIVAERGALVVGFKKDSDQPELGSRLDNVLGFKAPSEVSIAGLSDWQEWQEQVEAFYRLRPSWGRGKSADPSAIYYRVKFDPMAIRTRASSFPPGFGSSFSGSLVLPSLNQYMETGDLRGVSFWPRVAARAIDLVIHYALGLIAGILFAVLLRLAAGGPVPPAVLLRVYRTSFVLLFASLLGFFAYQVICTSVSGRSLGKLLLSMQGVQDDGTPCRLKGAFIRELGYFVDALFFGIIGYAAMKDDPQHKRHGDDWAGTMVCRRADLPASTRQDGSMKFLLGFMLGAFADIALMTLGILIQMNS